jgi:hypothetical protein
MGGWAPKNGLLKVFYQYFKNASHREERSDEAISKE